MKTSVKEIKEGKESLPPLRNPPLLETADDLATLSHLNEPSGGRDVLVKSVIALTNHPPSSAYNP